MLELRLRDSSGESRKFTGVVREPSGYSENSLILGLRPGLVLFRRVEFVRGTTIRPPGCGALGVPSSQTRFIETAAFLLSRHPGHRDIVFPYMTGRDLVETNGPTRWIIDLGQRDMLSAAAYSAAFALLQERVMPDVLAKAESEKLATGLETTRWTRMAQRWWQFRDWMPGTVAAVNANARYIVCPRVTKRATFAFVSREIRPDMQLMVFAFDDDYSFGILQSSAHWAWFVANSSKLTERLRYTSESVFDTLPWPQGPTEKAIAAIAAAGCEVRRIRDENLPKLKGGLRALYRTLELPGTNSLKDAHATLDAAVLAAYGFSARDDLLAQLLALNHQVAARIESGVPVTAPGLPLPPEQQAPFITDDCIRPPLH